MPTSSSMNSQGSLSIARVIGFILAVLFPWISMLYINVEAIKVSIMTSKIQEHIQKEEEVKSSLRVSQSRFPLDQQIEEFARNRKMVLGKSGQDIVTIPRVFNSEDQSMAKMNKNISVNSVISTQ
jgi:ribosomal protein S3